MLGRRIVQALPPSGQELSKIRSRRAIWSSTCREKDNQHTPWVLVPPGCGTSFFLAPPADRPTALRWTGSRPIGLRANVHAGSRTTAIDTGREGKREYHEGGGGLVTTITSDDIRILNRRGAKADGQ